MSNVLNFDVYKNTLKRRDGFSPVGGEFGYSQITCYFQEGDDWEDISIVTAGFYVNSKHVIAENPAIINHSLTVNIPAELLKKHEQIKFGLLGSVQNGNEAVMTIATNIVSIDVARGIVSDEFDQAAAEPGLYDRLIAAVNALLTVKADKTYVDSQNAAQDTVIGAKADKTYVDAQNAAQDAVIAGKASKVGPGSADELVSARSEGEIKRSGYRVRNDAGVIKNIESTASIVPTARAVGEKFEQLENAVLFKYAVADNTADPLPDNTVKLKDATAPKIIYIWGNGQGIIIPAVTASRQAQYFLGESGILRYRTRTKVNGAWPDWPAQFSTMETTVNKTATINSGSTDEQYPSAKAVYDSVEEVYDNTIRFETITSTELFDPNTHLDSQTIYRYIYNGVFQGIIIPANSTNKEAQYYFAQDGILRYRYRIKTGYTWGSWVNGDSFYSIINQETLEKNLFPYISPQNKLDKYFVRTCIDKSRVKLDENTQILGFGDSIMATSDGGSWLEILQARIGCPAPYNYGVGNAHFSNNTYARTRFIYELNNFLADVDKPVDPIDISTIDLIVVAGGTNDAKNGSPIDTFKTDVNEFFSSLKAGFTSRNVPCPPVLVITPIRRGTTTQINKASDNNIEITIAKYSAILNNSALQNGFSVLNGFDIPVLVDDMSIAVGSHTATITSFMLDDTQHVHPNATTGRETYAQAVIDAIGYSETFDISGKFDKSKIVKRATGDQVGLTQDTVFSTQAADDYLSYFLRDYATANQVGATIEEYLDALFLDTVHVDYPRLHIDNTIDQTYNPNGHYMMYYIDSALDRHNIFDFNIGGNVVTSGNDKISMGYDSGGFYFLFDDGQEAVNNGSN